MRSRSHGGFTLIELMIAVSLGMMIVMVAMAGFRVTSQAMTAAQRMARMNEIIGIGVVTALNEADYWDSYDDRQDTTAGFSRQRLRQSMALPAASVDGTTRLGLPFSPFTGTGSHTASWPSTTYGRGWKDDERLWAISADNELTWWTAHKAETQESDARFGHYSIFGVSRLPGRDQVVIDPTADKGFHGGWMPRNGGSFYGTIDITQTDIPDLPGNAGMGLAALRHSNPGWLFNQLRGLSNSLGWYGMFDYLPANAIVCYTMERSGRGRAGSSTHMTDYGSRELFNGDPAMFETIRVAEIRNWYEVRWSAAVRPLDFRYEEAMWWGTWLQNAFAYRVYPVNGSQYTGWGRSNRFNPNPMGTLSFIQRLDARGDGPVKAVTGDSLSW